MIAYKVFLHTGEELGLKTRVEKGNVALDESVLRIDGPYAVTIALQEINAVKLFRLHGLGRVIQIDHLGGRLFVSVVRFLIGQFAFNFFKTGELIAHTRIEEWDDRTAVALVLEDGTSFGLWRKGKFGNHNSRGGEHVHFAFQIKLDDYDHYVEKIKSLGLEPLHYVWPSGHRSVYFFDCDNHQGEFMTTDRL